MIIIIIIIVLYIILMKNKEACQKKVVMATRFLGFTYDENIFVLYKVPPEHNVRFDLFVQDSSYIVKGNKKPCCGDREKVIGERMWYYLEVGITR